MAKWGLYSVGREYSIKDTVPKSYHLKRKDLVFLLHITHSNHSMWTKMISVKKRTRKEYHVCVCVCVYSDLIYSIELHFFRWKVRSLKRISLRLFSTFNIKEIQNRVEGKDS